MKHWTRHRGSNKTAAVAGIAALALFATGRPESASAAQAALGAVRTASWNPSSAQSLRCPSVSRHHAICTACPTCAMDLPVQLVGGDAHLFLLRADAPYERLNIADTLKIPWQAYLGPGHPLLSGDGRVLATLATDGVHPQPLGPPAVAGAPSSAREP